MILTSKIITPASAAESKLKIERSSSDEARTTLRLVDVIPLPLLFFAAEKHPRQSVLLLIIDDIFLAFEIKFEEKTKEARERPLVSRSKRKLFVSSLVYRETTTTTTTTCLRDVQKKKRKKMTRFGQNQNIFFLISHSYLLPTNVCSKQHPSGCRSKSRDANEEEGAG